MIISKRRILAIFAIIAVVVLLSLVGYFAVRTPGAGNTILELERSDRAPDGADDTDVSPRLEWNDDPAVFWSNRVVWLDREVMKAAADHGRAYPPMPYVDPEAMAIAPTPLRHHVESLDIVVPRLKGNNRERWFWDKFSRTHPHPPDYLDALFVSESMSSGDSLLTAKKNGDPRWTSKTPGGLGSRRRDYPKMGIPIEMLDAESLAACCHLIKGDKPYDASSFRLSQQLAAGTIPAVEEFLERGFENASEVESELIFRCGWRHSMSAGIPCMVVVLWGKDHQGVFDLHLHFPLRVCDLDARVGPLRPRDVADGVVRKKGNGLSGRRNRRDNQRLSGHKAVSAPLCGCHSV